MIDVQGIKEKLVKDVDKVIDILEHYEFSKIKPKSKEIRCGWDHDSSGTSIVINLENLGAYSFSRDINGDIITLVMEKAKINFTTALSNICEIAGYPLDTVIDRKMK